MLYLANSMDYKIKYVSAIIGNKQHEQGSSTNVKKEKNLKKKINKIGLWIILRWHGKWEEEEENCSFEL